MNSLNDEKGDHEEGQQTNSRNSPRILLVDDDQDITFTLKMGLELNGFTVDVFNDPSEALIHYRPKRYNLLLLDVKMPKMNGFTLYQKIEKKDKNVKVCFITSFVEYYDSLREVFPTSDFGCFIKKPIDINELVTRLQAEIKQLL